MKHTVEHQHAMFRIHTEKSKWKKYEAIVYFGLVFVNIVLFYQQFFFLYFSGELKKQASTSRIHELSRQKN